MNEAQEMERPTEADAESVSPSRKPMSFNVEAAAAALLTVIGPNDPFPDQSSLKVYPCKFPK